MAVVTSVLSAQSMSNTFCIMSAKKQLAHAVQALPETVTIEEAVDRLLRAFQQKRAAGQPGQRWPPAELAGSLKILGDLVAPVFEEGDWDMLK